MIDFRDTRAFRYINTEAAIAALGLVDDPKAQREKGGAYRYLRSACGQLICLPLSSKAVDYQMWFLHGHGETRGDWLALAQFLFGGSLGDAKRRLMRLEGSQIDSFGPVVPRPHPTQETAAKSLRTLPQVLPEPGYVHRLLIERGLRQSIIDLARRSGMTGLKGFGSYLNFGFPHFSSDGELTGYELRSADPDFKRFGGRKTMFLVRPRPEPPRALYLVEAGIDALALVQLLGLDRGGAAWAGSLGGRPSEDALFDAVVGTARRFSIPRICAAHDRDAAGEDMASKIARICRDGGLEYIRVPPPSGPGIKDWADKTKAICNASQTQLQAA
ncbi:toprim domain-containing protein [Thiomonas sp. FB-Cd]|uniref:toprim domain-containing protein n=1 Tax=Thiomonas sp. FB-Cd TaxID=1158292 RepID=UPI0018CBFAB1|nr:toprim domain-containing protein [Thiomonas sp. FB-Cd]